MKKLGYIRNRNILIEEYKSIYFYIPKNGCTTIKKHIVDLNDYNKNFKSVHKFDFPFAPLWKLDTTYEDYLKFTFVRNPWSRLVSCYNSKIRSKEFTNNYFINGIHRGFSRFNNLFYGDMPFKEFAEAVCSIPDSKADSHFISQVFFLTDYSGKFLPNYIGRLENMKPSIDYIHDKTGFSMSNMGYKNQSKIKTPFTEYYDDDLKEKVRARYAVDIEIFDYEFETNPNKNLIGIVGDDFHQRLASPKYSIPLLEEKCNFLETVHQKEQKFKRKAKLKIALIDSSQKLKELKQELAPPQKPKILNYFNLKKLFSKKRSS